MLLLISFIVAFFMSPAGLSGAFLLLPFQISVLGITSPVVNSTNLVYNLIAIPSGIYGYVREKRVAWPIALIMILATFPGVYVGVILRVNFLLDPELFKFFVGLVLFYLGLRVGFSVFRPSGKMKEFEKKFKEVGLPVDAIVKVREIGFGRVEYEFWGEVFSFPPIPLFLISFVIGIVGGMYGIGGGAILAPILVSIFNLPIYTIAGATLLGTFLTSIFGVLNYCFVGYPPNWNIGIPLGVGGIFGMYFGARFQKFMSEKLIRIMLSTITLYISLNYIVQFIF